MQAFIARRQDVSRDAFREHYEEIHVGTALPILAGTSGYVRHHLREVLQGTPPFDCMTVFEYPDAATLAAVFARVAGSEAAAVHADEETFMHTPSNFFFPVEEGPGWRASPQRVGIATWLVCARRPPGEEARAFRARFAAEALPRLSAALEDAVSWRAFWPRDPAARYDATALLAAAGQGRLASAARELEREGCEVVAARVSVHATEMARPPR